jgi:anti-anti-sigma factor
MSVRTLPPGALTIECVSDAGTTTLTLRGELDIASAPALEERLRAAEGETPTRIVIDLSQLQFIDSTGLRILLQANTRVAESSHELVLRPGNATVQRVFETTGVSPFFSFQAAPAS